MFSSSARPSPLFTITIGGRKIYFHHYLIKRVLKLLWVFLVIIGELCVFFWSLVGCRWPSFNKFNGHKTHQRVPTTHVLLVADTQVHLFSQASWSINSFRRILFELNLRKSWGVTSRLKPNAVVFLGDMLSNGKGALTSEAFALGVQKFKSIFQVSQETEVHYVPGNNDVGLGLNPLTSQKLQSYYTSSFGPLNAHFNIHNHTFVALDSPGLVDEDYVRHSLGVPVPFEIWTEVPDGSVAFVNKLAKNRPERVILLSHIPLSRPDSATCGPLRERGTIGRGAGPSWQSMLGKQTTDFLLTTLRPLMVFSADNRDYCDYTHVLSPYSSENRPNSIREITLKSFSMSVHIRRPGFHLLSLIDPSYISNTTSDASEHNPTSILEKPCFLPDQYRIYTSLYFPLLTLSFILLAYANFRKPKRSSTMNEGRGSFRSKHPGLILTRSPPMPNSLAGSRSGSGSSGPSSPLPNGAGGLWSPLSHSNNSRSLSVASFMRTPHSPNASSPVTHLFASPRSGTPVSFGFGEGGEGGEYFEEEDVMYPSQYLTRFELQGRNLSASSSRSLSGRHGHVRQGSEIFDLEALRSPRHFAGALDLEAEVEEGPSHSDSMRVLSALPNHRFISAPTTSSKSVSSTKKEKGTIGMTATSRWTEEYSYHFTFRGRRRRVVGLPFCGRVRNLMEFVFGIGDEDGPFHRLKRRRKSTGLNGFVLDVLDVFWPAMVVWLVVNLVVLL